MNAVSGDIKLVRVVRQIRFGCIENILLVDGHPVFDENTDVVRSYKFSAEEPRKEVITEDEYLEKRQVRMMLQTFRTIGTGTIGCLEVQEGLPFKMSVRHKAALQ